jgi:lipoprotein signal peptidase
MAVTIQRAMETPRLTEVQNNGKDYSSFSSRKQASPFTILKVSVFGFQVSAIVFLLPDT